MGPTPFCARRALTRSRSCWAAAGPSISAGGAASAIWMGMAMAASNTPAITTTCAKRLWRLTLLRLTRAPGTQMGKADLHVHSRWSDGLATVPQIMAHACAETDLDVIGIADHDQIGGAL